MPQPMMMGPPQVDKLKQKYIDKKAEEVVKALKGVSIADIGMVIQTAQQKIFSSCKV